VSPNARIPQDVFCGYLGARGFWRLNLLGSLLDAPHVEAHNLTPFGLPGSLLNAHLEPLVLAVHHRGRPDERKAAGCVEPLQVLLRPGDGSRALREKGER